MLTVTRSQLVECFNNLGIHASDGLLVHSAIQYLGKPSGGVSIYLDALCEVLEIDLAAPESQYHTCSGTLAVPTFNFGFARGEPYDPQSTPSKGMGVFSELVRQHPAARRTPHPMQSLAVIGALAKDLANRDTLSAFDPGSAYDKMLESGFKIMLLGADVQAISVLHYSEQRIGVPYRFWKDFTGQVKTAEGWQVRTYRMYARDLSIDAHIDLHPVQKVLENRGLWYALPLHYGWISVCEMCDFAAVVDEFLLKDAWSLVTNRPEES